MSLSASKCQGQTGGKPVRVFTAAEFVAYYADEGVTRHFSMSYTLQQNGVVEQWN
jgi:hypothetical protein